MRALLSVALYEIEDERTPDYAVVDAAVNTAKATDAVRAAGLINAVLRRYLRERKTLDAEIARKPATRHASPDLAGGPSARRLAGALDAAAGRGRSQAPMWLRVNTAACTTDGLPRDACSRPESGRAPRRGYRRRWCWTHPAMCMTCRVSRRARLGARSGRAMRGISARAGARSASTRCLRCAGREDRADGGTRAALEEADRGRHRSAAAAPSAMRICSAARLECRGRRRRCGDAGALVGRRPVRSHLARCAVFGARGDSPPSRHPLA